MICGTCRKPFKLFSDVMNHWRKAGCHWARPVWVKVAESKRRGHSGRRHLAAAYPHLYKPRPMSEEVKEKLRLLGDKRMRISKRSIEKVKMVHQKRDGRRKRREGK